jgi:hypothetical protein
MISFAKILAKKNWTAWNEQNKASSNAGKDTAARWAKEYGGSQKHDFKVGDKVKHTRTGEAGTVDHVQGGYVSVNNNPHFHTSLTKVS